MKKQITLTILFISLSYVFAQGIAINEDGTAPDGNAILELKADDKGLLLPRVALTNTTSFAPLSAHVEGMKVFNTALTGDVTQGVYYNDGSKWVRVSTGIDAKTQPWFNQSNIGEEAELNTDNIYHTGKVSIGSNETNDLNIGGSAVPIKFHVEGNMTTTGKVYTTNSVYADYVFEKYFNGYSDLNESYKFSSLEEVLAFIEANHHLPGVASIKDLKSTEAGYVFDMTSLSIQQLEKIEELFLHAIEQEKKLKQQTKEIDELKSRIERLEKFISND